MRRRAWTTLTPALAVAAMAAPGASAAPPVAQLQDASPVSAYAGAVAYSRRDAPGGAFRLVLYRGGVTTVLPVAPKRVPFDVDLGPGPDGGIVAVYSRCATEPPLVSLPDNWTVGHGRGCRIHAFDPTSGRETLVPGTHRAGASESLPTVWKDRVAFARSPAGGSTPPQLWLRRQGSAAVRLPGGPAFGCRGTGAARRCARPFPQATPLSLDLRGDQLAYAWRMPDIAETPAHEIRIVTPGRPARVVDHTNGGGLSYAFVAWPVFDGPDLYYAHPCFGDGCAHRFGITRYVPRTDTRTSLPLADRATIGFAHTAGRSFTLLAPLPTSGSCTTDEPGVPAGCLLTAADDPGR